MRQPEQLRKLIQQELDLLNDKLDKYETRKNCLERFKKSIEDNQKIYSTNIEKID
jgi:hypothetical protein